MRWKGWFWGKTTIKRYFSSCSDETPVEIEKLIEFLSNSRLRDGRSITEQVEMPEMKRGGWNRLQWTAFNKKEMPLISSGGRAFQNEGKAEWARAWHVCKMKAAYSDELAQKAEGYMKQIDLFEGGVFWATTWGVGCSEFQGGGEDEVPHRPEGSNTRQRPSCRALSRPSVGPWNLGAFGLESVV